MSMNCALTLINQDLFLRYQIVAATLKEWYTQLHTNTIAKLVANKHAHIHSSGFLIPSQLHKHAHTQVHSSGRILHLLIHTNTHIYGTCPAFAHCHHTHVRSLLVATATPTSGNNIVHVTWSRRGGSTGCSVPTCICLFNISAHFKAHYSFSL